MKFLSAFFVAAFLLFLAASIAQSGAPLLAPPGGTGSTTARNVAVDPNRDNYVGIGTTNPPTDRLTLIDGSLSQGPPFILNVIGKGSSGNIAPQTGNALYLLGRYGYVALSSDDVLKGFRIVDISDPRDTDLIGNKQIIGSLFSDGTNGIAASGRYLYLIFNKTTPSDMFRIVDIADQSFPKVMGGGNISAGFPNKAPTALAVSGKYAYIAFSSGVGAEFRVVDISKPNEPFVVGSITAGFPLAPRSMVVKGTYVYVTFKQDATVCPPSCSNAFRVVDVSNATKPVVVGGSGVVLPDSAAKNVPLAVSGGYAYLGFASANDPNNFRIIDVTNPTNPIDVTPATAIEGIPQRFGGGGASNVNAVAVSGRYLFLAFGESDDDTKKFRIVDVIKPTNPKVVGGSVVKGVYDLTANAPTSIAVEGRYIYAVFGNVAEEYNFWRTIDISGLEGVSANIHSLEAGNLHALGNVKIGGDLSIAGSLTAGGPSFLGTTTVLHLMATGTVYKGAGTFRIDHPLFPKTMNLEHSFVESSEMKNIYDGVIILDQKGRGIVELPKYFEALNKDFRYQFEPIGGPAPGLTLVSPIKNNQFIIGGGTPFQEISWQVTGIRKDPYAEQHSFMPERMKDVPGYLRPELFRNEQ